MRWESLLPVAVYAFVTAILDYVRGGTAGPPARWLDVGWWQSDLQPERENPTEPHPFRSMYDAPAVVAALAEGQRKLTVEVKA